MEAILLMKRSFQFGFPKKIGLSRSNSFLTDQHFLSTFGLVAFCTGVSNTRITKFVSYILKSDNTAHDRSYNASFDTSVLFDRKKCRNKSV